MIVCGTYSGYSRHRRRNEPACQPCKDALAEYSREYRALTRSILGPTVIEAELVRRHVERLRAAGVSVHAIKAASGVARSTIDHLLNGTSSRVTASVARRLLAVGPDAATYVPAIGTQRRIQALGVMGWPMKGKGGLSERLGHSPARVGLILRQTHVRPSTAEAVASLYDELGMTPGTSVRAATRARANGWLPPLAWDDDTIDLPDADLPFENVQEFYYAERNTFHAPDIDPVAVERFVYGLTDWRKITKAERIEAAILMDRKGISRNEIGRRTALNTATLRDAWAGVIHSDAQVPSDSGRQAPVPSTTDDERRTA